MNLVNNILIVDRIEAIVAEIKHGSGLNMLCNVEEEI